MPRLGHKKYAPFPLCQGTNDSSHQPSVSTATFLCPLAKTLRYTRSRLGCRQCKARHVKCDELKPCSNCARHGVSCSLTAREPAAPQSLTHVPPKSSSASKPPAQAPKHQSSAKSPSAKSSSSLHIDHSLHSSPPQETPNSANSAGSSPASQSDQFPFLSRFIHRSEAKQADIWVRDLELMHHWTVEACLKLSPRDDMRYAWQVEAPQQATIHTFLMHEILAFSAFHKAFKDVEQQSCYYACGIHHQDAAIRGIRQRLHSVTPYYAAAMVATSTLLTLSVFASTGLEAGFPEVANSQSVIDDMLNIFHLMQGMGSMLAMAWQYVADSFLAPLIRSSPNGKFQQPLLQKLEQQLPILIAFIESKNNLVESERTTYLEAIAGFRPALDIATSPIEQELRFLFNWPLHLKPIYLTYLRERRSGALAVMSHYAIIYFAAEPKYWYLEGWANRLMTTCCSGVDQSWISILQWPLSFLGQTTAHNSYEQCFPQICKSEDDDHTYQPSMSIPHRQRPHSSPHSLENIPSTLTTQQDPFTRTKQEDQSNV